jgi:hypothetical protein
MSQLRRPSLARTMLPKGVAIVALVGGMRHRELDRRPGDRCGLRRTVVLAGWNPQ